MAVSATGGNRPVLEHGSASATFAPRPPSLPPPEAAGGRGGRRVQPGVNAGPNARLRRKTGVNARHPFILGTSNLDDLWVRTSLKRRAYYRLRRKGATDDPTLDTAREQQFVVNPLASGLDPPAASVQLSFNGALRDFPHTVQMFDILLCRQQTGAASLHFEQPSVTVLVYIDCRRVVQQGFIESDQAPAGRGVQITFGLLAFDRSDLSAAGCSRLSSSTHHSRK